MIRIACLPEYINYMPTLSDVKKLHGRLLGAEYADFIAADLAANQFNNESLNGYYMAVYDE